MKGWITNMTYDRSYFKMKKTWIAPLIVMILTAAAGAVVLLTRYEVISFPALSDSMRPDLLTGLGVVSCMVAIIALLYMISSLHGNSKYAKDIERIGQEELLDQMNNHCVYKAGKESHPTAFVTEKYLIKSQINITEIAKISWIYRVSTNNRVTARVKLIDNKDDHLGVSAYDNSYKPMVEALKSVNPNIIEGYANRAEHMKRVAEYKNQK